MEEMTQLQACEAWLVWETEQMLYRRVERLTCIYYRTPATDESRRERINMLTRRCLVKKMALQPPNEEGR